MMFRYVTFCKFNALRHLIAQISYQVSKYNICALGYNLLNQFNDVVVPYQAQIALLSPIRKEPVRAVIRCLHLYLIIESAIVEIAVHRLHIATLGTTLYPLDY